MKKTIIKRVVSLSLALCMLMALALCVSAAEKEGIFKPAVPNEVLYWGSNKVSGTNETVKFTGYLYSPSGNYNKSHFWVALRSKTLCNPWDGPDGGYFIFLDKNHIFVKYCNENIYKAADAMKPLIDAAGSYEAFYTVPHDFEFSIMDVAEGVRLIGKVDGTVVLDWIDTDKRVTNAGGFRVNAEDVFEMYINKLVFIGDDGVEVDMLTEENIGLLSTNSKNLGGYANPVTPVTPEPPNTGDPIAVFVCLMLASATGVAVLRKKRI